MAFLFSTYIIIYAVVGTLLGRVVDNSFKKYKSVIPVLKQVGGIQVRPSTSLLSSRSSWPTPSQHVV